jgi:uncharacterized protein (DUF433 family)
MPRMETYVTPSDADTLRVTGTRVSLASLVHAYWRSESPESIVQSFPSLSLEQVHGALAYYLRHRVDVDRELERDEERASQLRAAPARAAKDPRDRLLRSRVER